MEIVNGDIVEVTTANGEQLLMRALSAVTMGRDFEVVWVATIEEWDRALRDGDEPDGLPWPADALRLAQPTHRPDNHLTPAAAALATDRPGR